MHPQTLNKRQANPDGVVLDLTLRGDGIIDAFYTVDLILGDSGQTYPMLIDTGSSDLWVASSACQNCGAPASYDPARSSTSIPTSQTFSNNYLSGFVSGPVYWEELTLGGYTILHQALCAADTVRDEKLSEGFSGILGLGLPPLSSIQQSLGSDTGADTDGAAFTSNLFGLPSGIGPSAKFFTVSVSRPGFTDPERSIHSVPSRLGIGRHVEEIQHLSPSNEEFERRIQWAHLIPSLSGYTHWKPRLTSITVWKDSTPNIVSLGTGVDAGPYPVAALDTGGPNWMGSRRICDALYGAWGVGMSQDGMYYVPCDTLMNITIKFDSLPPIPLHPLDLSNHIDNNPNINPTTCLGTLQYSPQLGTPNSPADIVLGVSFLRNVYTVHDLSPPSGDDDDGSNNSGMGTGDGSEAPRLGILPLTDISLAITEFHNIRILNRGPDGGSNLPSVATGAGKKSMSIIGKVMLGLGILVGVCVALFALRWFVLSRRFKKQGGRLSRWGTVSEAHRTAESVPMRERLDDLRRRGTRRFKQITDYGTPDGIEGDVATRSAIGHGSSLSRANSSRFTAAVHGQPESERPENARQPTGPWAGFSLATFIGAKRLGFGGGYTRTANPALGETVEDVPPVPPLPSLPDAGRQPSEDELRQRRFEEYYRRKTEERRFAGRGNEPSIWSDTTLIHRADIPLTPLDTPGTTGTITGSTTNLNLYGYPKVDENGILVREDDASTERSGSTLHGSPELPPKGAFAASATSLDRMVRDSREHLLLNPQASSSSLGGRQVDHTHRPVPSLDLERPPVARVDSSGIITSSPYPLTDSGPPTPSIPASSPGSLPTPETQGPIDQPSLMPFNPYNIPISIPPPATPPAVHSPRVRVAAEPTLSPLTEVTSQEQGSSRSDPSNLRRITPFGSVTPVSALSSDSSAERGGETDKLMRSTSIGALSMESEVLVPLPITLIERAKAKGEPVPVLSTKPRSTEGERGEEPWPAPFSKTIVPTPTKTHLVASQSIPSVASTSTTPVQSQRTGKSFDAPEALDSRSPTLNVSSRNDSRFQLPSSPSAQPTPHLRPPNPHSASASPSRPAPVAMQEPVPLARSRLPDPTIPRPSEMHVDAGSEIFIPPRRFDEETGSGRSSSGSSAGMIANTRPIPASNRGASPPRIRERPTGSPFSDFMPPHEVRRPQEQQTLPAIGGARPRLPESAIASVGARHRGPRPITHKRTTSSDVSTSFASSPSSARRETGYGPLLAISTPSPASLGRSPGPYSASSDPISPPASSGTPYLHGAYPVNGFIEGELILPDATSSIANIPTEPQPLSSLPDTVDRTQDRGEYISGETLPANIGWREEAARTAGMAGLGARSKFMGNSLDYSPPSKQ